MKPNSFGILVAGMHRSGTSATAGALQCLGVALGERLLTGAQDNPKGYFEHEGVVHVHETLLRELGSWWSDPRPLPEGWMAMPAARRAEDDLVDILRRDFAGESLWAVKDPRACRMVALWRRCVERLGMASGVLHVVRSPAEVASSLRSRNGFGKPLGELLWLRHVLDAARDSDGMPRTVVLYDDLLGNPVDVMRRALQALGVDVPALDAGQVGGVGEFVEPGLRRHGAGTTNANTAISAIASDVFEVFKGLAAGQDAWSRLDALRGRFDEAWAGMDPIVGAMAESVFPTLDGFAKLEAEGYALRSQLNAQLAWSEQAVLDHRATMDERDALAHSAAQTVLDHRAMMAERDALAHSAAQALAESVAHADALAEQLRIRSADLHQRTVDLEARADELARGEIEIASLQQQLARARQEYSDVIHSASWRWTSPLRFLRSRLGRRKP